MTGPSPQTPGLIMPPPFFSVIALVLALLLEWLLPLAFLPAPGFASWALWFGLLLFIGGTLLVMPAIAAFRAAATPVEPTRPSRQLVTTGLYRFSRNPMYLGCLLWVLGLSLMASLEWGVILTPMQWLAFDLLVVRKEEAFLHRKFGEAYAQFCRQTRRWL